MTDYIKPEIKTALPGPKGKEVIARDKEFMSTSSAQGYPFVMSHGEGAWVWDVDGNRFLDLMAGIAVSATGYNHPKITKAVQAQAEKYLHMYSYTVYSPLAGEYAEKLTKASPIKGNGKNRVFFANTGAEVWDGALKLARYKTGRQNIICFYGAFHGRTFAGITGNASKITQRRGFGPLVPGFYHAFYPAEFVCPFDKETPHTVKGCIDYIKDYLFKKIVSPDEVAAIALEPIQGEGGYIVPPKEFLQEIRKLCDEHGILMIVDEVQSGMGRTGKMFAIDHFDVKPDIITAAKGIASGLPLAAFIANETVIDWPLGAHGSTFGGNAMALSAALVTFDLLQNELMDNAASVGTKMLSRLKDFVSRYSMIGDVRGIGLMVGLEIVRNKSSGVLPDPEMRDKIIQKCFERGLLMLGCGSHAIRFCPPLVISEQQAMMALDIVEEVLKELN
jgi:4-aminobutyrate aminotransferase